jgi:hypothetical protein
MAHQDKVFNQYAIHTWFTATIAAAWRRTSRPRATSSSSTFCLSPTPGLADSDQRDRYFDWRGHAKQNFAKSKEGREEFFWECIKSRPELYEGLKAQGSEQQAV